MGDLGEAGKIPCAPPLFKLPQLSFCRRASQVGFPEMQLTIAHYWLNTK
jgi:hypothetical protein